MNRIATRFVLALVMVAAVAIAIVAFGVLGVAQTTFADLMVSHGATSAAAHAMFDESVKTVFLLAAGSALIVSVALALVLALRMTRPLRRLQVASNVLAAGDYSTRVEADGAAEFAAVARSFNSMAQSLEAADALRRQLVTDFAHELRTPLTNLSGYLEAIRDGVMSPTPELMASLAEEVDRLTRLSRSLDLLADGSEGPDAMVELDISGAVERALEITRPAFQKGGIRVERETVPGLRARANPDHLAQVLHNLLSNASRYTPRGGTVVVSASPAGGGVLVAVVNSAETIPQAELPRLWDRFYRLDRSRDRASGGAGIGLAIVKQLVESAGGRVGAESAGGNNRFWFSLPAPRAH